MNLSWLLLLALLLVAWPLLLRRLDLGEPAEARWSTPLDLGLALALVLVLAAWWALWLGPWSLFPWPVLARDFAQVCHAVLAAADGTAGAFPQRSPVAALLPGSLRAPLGLIDGLLAASTLATAATLAGLHLWARALSGRTAALSAVLLAGALPALATLPRQLSLYPELIAAFVLSAAAGAAALRWRSSPALLACGLGAGLALLLDPRGLHHGLAALLAGLLALRRPWQILLLLLPLLASWLLAAGLWPASSPGLEVQLSWYAADGGPPPELALSHPAFLWGHSPLTALPATLAWLLDRRTGSLALGPWLVAASAALPLVLWSLRTEPRRLLALLLTGAPFAAVALTATHVRHQAWGFVLVPLLLGLGCAALSRQDVPPRRTATGLALTGLFLLALVSGLLPSPLSPRAVWRQPVPETPDIDALLAVHPDRSSRAALPFADPQCVRALQVDLDQGHPWGGRWVGPWPEWELRAP